MKDLDKLHKYLESERDYRYSMFSDQRTIDMNFLHRVDYWITEGYIQVCDEPIDTTCDSQNWSDICHKQALNTTIRILYNTSLNCNIKFYGNGIILIGDNFYAYVMPAIKHA